MKPLSEWTDDELWCPVLDAGRDGRDGAKADERERVVNELLRRARYAMKERCAETVEAFGRVQFGEIDGPSVLGRERDVIGDAVSAIRGLQ